MIKSSLSFIQKSFITGAVLTGLLLFSLFNFYSCKEAPDTRMDDFAAKFAEFAKKNQRDSIQVYYPDYNKIDSVKANIPTDHIRLEPTQPDGYWKVVYGDDMYMNVLLSQDGHITVKETYGLFGYSEKVVELAKAKGLWNPKEKDIEQAEKIAKMLEERKTFTSPDLTFFNLHGPVKSMTIIYSDSVNNNIFDNFWGWSCIYHFSEDGYLTDESSIRISSSNSLQKIDRDSKGRIIKMKFKETDDWDGENFYFWEEDKLVRAQSHYESYNALFTYHPDNFLDRMGYRYGNTEGVNGADITLADYELDDMGNWTQCHWSMQIMVPVPYYSAITADLVGYKDGVKETKTGSMKREIIYY